MKYIVDPKRIASVERGFSLVEVVLALGVISVAIVSLFGLLAISTDASRQSDVDTVVTSIARQVDTQLHNTPFANLPASGAAWYFDNEGHHLTESDDVTTPPAAAVYQCVMTLTGDADYDFPKDTNLYRVELVFSRAVGKKSKDIAVLQSINTALYRND